jgi:hypothetical protein
VVAAPGEQVERRHGSVGELGEEDLLGWDPPDLAGVVALGQDVEGVQAYPEGRVRGGLDDLPAVPVVTDSGGP